MCRLALYSGMVDSALLRLTVKSFRLSTQFDMILDSFRRGRRSHNHGWGLACVAMKFNELFVMHFKTSLPLLSEDFKSLLRAISRDVWWMHLLLHSRLTSSEPINVHNAHPFHTSKVGAYSIWLAHNGSVNKQVLAEKLGLLHLVNQYADSYFITQWLGKTVGEAEPNALLDSLKSLIEMNIVKTALNVIGIVLSESSNHVFSFALNYVSQEGQSLAEYYRLYKLLNSEKTSLVVASSTVFKYLNYFAKISGEAMDNGEAVITEVKNGVLEVKSRKIA